jgi:hypothetical protein
MFAICSFQKIGTGLFRPLVAGFENGSGSFWNQRSATLVEGMPLGGDLFMEGSMTMHSDHSVTDREDAAFDSTIKIGGIVVAVIAIAVAAAWYFAG